jgi:hypothetical protein
VIGFSNKTDAAGLKSIIEILDYPLHDGTSHPCRWITDNMSPRSDIKPWWKLLHAQNQEKVYPFAKPLPKNK